MADLPQQNTIVQYLADGITTTYIVPFYTPVETDGTPDLAVYTQLASAVPVPAQDINEWNVAYTYTPNPDPTTGGIITFQAGFIPPSGYAVTIVRVVSASLDVEFSDATTFSGITLDAALDKLLLISQQNLSYALQRNLSYIVNSYLPEATLMANVQIPVLGNNQVWFGSAGGVIAATLAQGSDVSTLRSELANNAPVTNGAALVGYYDTVNDDATTVAAQLTYLTDQVTAPFPSGSIIDFGGTVAPAGFLLCDGTQYLIATYPTLFAAISNTWGGDGVTYFKVPDLSGLVTAGSGGTLPPLSNSVGSTGGGATHVMQASELVGHFHGLSGQTGTPFTLQINTGASSLLTTTGGSNATQIAGSNPPAGFTIVQPTAIVLKIIKI